MPRTELGMVTIARTVWLSLGTASPYCGEGELGFEEPRRGSPHGREDRGIGQERGRGWCVAGEGRQMILGCAIAVEVGCSQASEEIEARQDACL